MINRVYCYRAMSLVFIHLTTDSNEAAKLMWKAADHRLDEVTVPKLSCNCLQASFKLSQTVPKGVLNALTSMGLSPTLPPRYIFELIKKSPRNPTILSYVQRLLIVNSWYVNSWYVICPFFRFFFG